MLSKIISTIVICGVLLALWQMSGGSPQEFFNIVWGGFYTAVNWVAGVFTTAWNTVFSSF